MQAINSHNSMSIMTMEDTLRVLGGRYGDEPQPLDLVVTRHDVLDEASFRCTGVLELYEQLLPAIERDSPMTSCAGCCRTMSASPGISASAASRSPIGSTHAASSCVRACDRARLLHLRSRQQPDFCNHVGIDRAWRRGGQARAFYCEMVVMFDALFPRNIDMRLVRYLADEDSALLSRWRRLAIDLPI